MSEYDGQPSQRKGSCFRTGLKPVVNKAHMSGMLHVCTLEESHCMVSSSRDFDSSSLSYIFSPLFYLFLFTHYLLPFSHPPPSPSVGSCHCAHVADESICGGRTRTRSLPARARILSPTKASVSVCLSARCSTNRGERGRRRARRGREAEERERCEEGEEAELRERKKDGNKKRKRSERRISERTAGCGCSSRACDF